MSVTNTRSIGHPGKRGTLDMLFDRMLKGVSMEIRQQLRSNLDTEIFGADSYHYIARNYKTNDIETVARIRSYLGRSDATQSSNGSENSAGLELPLDSLEGGQASSANHPQATV